MGVILKDVEFIFKPITPFPEVKKLKSFPYFYLAKIGDKDESLEPLDFIWGLTFFYSISIYYLKGFFYVPRLSIYLNGLF